MKKHQKTYSLDVTIKIIDQFSCVKLFATPCTVAYRAPLPMGFSRQEYWSGVGKTRDLFKKIRDTKGKFHVKMGSIKDRNGMDLTEAEDIKEMARIHRRTVQKRSSRPR